MARRHRFHSPSSTYHVMLRGNDGQPIFFSSGDRSKMCLLLQQGIERYGHSVEAFCFMSNHIHLAVRVSDISISRIIHHLAFRYTRYINRTYNRIGHLFQGRFKSVLVEDEEYLKELIRYIHLNPVRAGIVSEPQDYLWCSHKAYMGLDDFVWLSKERILKKFHQEREDSIQIYQYFVLKGVGIETELNFKSGSCNGILGNKEFIEENLTKVTLGKKIKRNIELPEFIAKVCAMYGLSQQDLCSPGKYPRPSEARALLALLTRQSDTFSLEVLGQYLGRDPIVD
jgi:putative transposase